MFIRISSYRHAFVTNTLHPHSTCKSNATAEDVHIVSLRYRDKVLYLVRYPRPPNLFLRTSGFGQERITAQPTQHPLLASGARYQPPSKLAYSDLNTALRSQLPDGPADCRSGLVSRFAFPLLLASRSHKHILRRDPRHSLMPKFRSKMTCRVRLPSPAQLT
jgi:hypothetical protein